MGIVIPALILAVSLGVIIGCGLGTYDGGPTDIGPPGSVPIAIGAVAVGAFIATSGIVVGSDALTVVGFVLVALGGGAVAGLMISS